VEKLDEIEFGIAKVRLPPTRPSGLCKPEKRPNAAGCPVTLFWISEHHLLQIRISDTRRLKASLIATAFRSSAFQTNKTTDGIPKS
jgi:hypothetical protein